MEIQIEANLVDPRFWMYNGTLCIGRADLLNSLYGPINYRKFKIAICNVCK